MYNLLKLLNEHEIEIPVIQRDYAQGRKNAKVNRIREGFVEALLGALDSPLDCGLHLDFIYGKIESQSVQNVMKNNYNHVESILTFAQAYTSQVKVGLTGKIPAVDREVLSTSKTKLMPLDGQQRLTTLWLVHFVLYHQSSRTIPAWMQNFNYKTRKSSTSFLNSLIQNTDLDKTNLYSIAIKKSKWFYKSWLQDPTVKGMLVTLDEIQRQLSERYVSLDEEGKNEKLEKWISNLEDQNDSTIQFSFLPLSDIDVNDDIYIKMNDRGKQLTDFEIFKNDLLDYLKDLLDKKPSDFSQKEYDKIAQNIDKKWHDIFWKEKDGDSFNIEFTFHYFFLYNLLLYKMSNVKKDELIPSDYFSALVGDKRSSNFEQFDFRQLEELDLISLESLKYVFENLELLSEAEFLKAPQEIVDEVSFKKDGVPEYGKNFLKQFLKSDAVGIGYYHRTYHYAITSYLYLFKNNLDPDLFKQWSRVLQNLIYNQAYIQGKDDFEAAVRHIDILLKAGLDIENTLISAESLDVFPRQLNEEIEKVRLYKSRPELYSTFVKLEEHPFFHGQIKFLINLSKDDESSIINLQDLKTFGKKLSFIFQPENINDGSFLFARALLTELNYFHNKGRGRWQFFSNNNSLRNKQEDWRYLFDRNDRLLVVKSFLNKISNENIIRDLTKIIEDYYSDQWKYYFVKEPGLWKLGKNNLLKKFSNENVRIWKTLRAYGEQYELRTKYLQLTWKDDLDPFERLKYRSVNSEDEHPFCYFEGWNRDDFDYHLEIRYFEKQYELKFLNVNKSNLYKIEQEVRDKLIQLKFEEDYESEYYFHVTEEEGESIDELLNSKLNNVLEILKLIS
jgi:hypothetical protein